MTEKKRKPVRRRVRSTPRKGRRVQPGNWPEIDRTQLPGPVVAILDEHKYIARLLLLLQDQIAAIEHHGEVDYDTIGGVMRYMVNIPDVFHHPKEDLIFERMSGSDEELAGTIQQLREGHRAIVASGRSLLEKATTAAASGKPGDLRELCNDLRHYVKGLREHMETEETRVFVPAVAQLSSADWRDIDRLIKPVLDPVFSDTVAEEYLPIFGKYLNRASRIATGAVPFMLIEGVAAGAEQALHAGVAIGDLSWRLLQEGERSTRRQLQLLRRTVRARGAKAKFRSLRRASNAQIEWIRTSVAMVLAALEPDELQALEKRPPAPQRRTMRLRKELETVMESPLPQQRLAGVSWQAVAMNLLLRLTVKQMMAWVSLDRAGDLQKLVRVLDRVPTGVNSAPVATNQFRGEWLRTDKVARERAILHLPGGAFILPATPGHRTMLDRVCRACDADGLLVHYRLAPEHPFPAGLEDALAAYGFLLESGIEPRNIVIMGDSAGGGLALSLVLALKQQGAPLPCGVVLMSALTDLNLTNPSQRFNRWRDTLLPVRRDMQNYKIYRGKARADHPLLSPVFGNFRGFPPIFAQVSSTETLLDDTLRVARKARGQGVDFEVEVWEGLPHDWHIFGVIPEAVEALARVSDFVRRHLGREHTGPAAQA
jgi:acetyl esterase/lipase/hemerythrin-like domain-containing protein